MATKPSSGTKPARPRASRPAAAPRVRRTVRAVDTPIPHDEIARLALSYWDARGRDGGSPEEDWLRAEQELKAQGSAASKKK